MDTLTWEERTGDGLLLLAIITAGICFASSCDLMVNRIAVRGLSLVALVVGDWPTPGSLLLSVFSEGDTFPVNIACLPAADPCSLGTSLAVLITVVLIGYRLESVSDNDESHTLTDVTVFGVVLFAGIIGECNGDIGTALSAGWLSRLPLMSWFCIWPEAHDCLPTVGMPRVSVVADLETILADVLRIDFSAYLAVCVTTCLPITVATGMAVLGAPRLPVDIADALVDDTADLYITDTIGLLVVAVALVVDKTIFLAATEHDILDDKTNFVGVDAGFEPVASSGLVESGTTDVLTFAPDDTEAGQPVEATDTTLLVSAILLADGLTDALRVGVWSCFEMDATEGFDVDVAGDFVTSLNTGFKFDVAEVTEDFKVKETADLVVEVVVKETADLVVEVVATLKADVTWILESSVTTALSVCATNGIDAGVITFRGDGDISPLGDDVTTPLEVSVVTGIDVGTTAGWDVGLTAGFDVVTTGLLFDIATGLEIGVVILEGNITARFEAAAVVDVAILEGNVAACFKVGVPASLEVITVTVFDACKIVRVIVDVAEGLEKRSASIFAIRNTPGFVLGMTFWETTGLAECITTGCVFGVDCLVITDLSPETVCPVGNDMPLTFTSDVVESLLVALSALLESCVMPGLAERVASDWECL